MDEFIPLLKLEEGFEKQTSHIQGMIDSSKILFDSRNNTMSIAISILILEELTKFRDISIHLRERKSITKDEWDALSKIGSHNTKLTKLFENVQEEVIKMGEEHHKKVIELNRKLGENDHLDFESLSKANQHIQQLKNLNTIKKECIYLDWKDGEWNTFETMFVPRGQAILAEVLFYQNLLVFLDIILEHRHPTTSLDEQSPKFKAYQNDPVRQKIAEIDKIRKTKEFKEKIMTAQAIMADYSKKSKKN
jgi:AbiV family abortive infection protein